jgi:putative transposase
MSFPRLVKQRKKSRVMGEVEVVRRDEYEERDLDAKVELIRGLIPLGLMHAHELLDQEVRALAGPLRLREDGRAGNRHGSNPGSVRLGGQRVPIRVPRVRSSQGEIPLRSYGMLHDSDGEVDPVLLRRVLYGISCRNYEAAAESIPGAIGLSSSTVSRAFVSASAAQLRAFQERDLSNEDVVGLFLDEKVLTPFLRSLVDRGLDVSGGLLVVIDGGKGLRSAVNKALKGRAVVQRCQWHKRENVVGYLARSEQAMWRRRLQKAYERPTEKEARAALEALRGELEEKNQSAAASLAEGLEETLTLHRLNVFGLLGRSLKTTNCLESVNALVEERCAKVDAWKNSDQKQRWLATALMEIEPRLRRIVGYRHLPKLREAIQRELKIEIVEQADEKAA